MKFRKSNRAAYLEQVEELAKVTKDSKYSSFKDLVDVDLIHFAVGGIFVKGRRRPHLCFTTDAQDIIRKRIVLYRAVLSHAFKVVRKAQAERPIPFDVGNSVPGAIAFVSSSGHIESVERVKLISYAE